MTRKAIGYQKERLFPDLVYWLLLGITAANYSVITFSMAGEFNPGGVLKPIAFLRLPLSAIGAFYLFSISRARGNTPVLATLFLMYMSSFFALFFAPDFVQASAYVAWFIFQTLFIFKYVEYLIATHGHQRARVKLLLPIMIMGGYFLVLTVLGLPNYSIGQPFPAFFSDKSLVAMFAPLFFGGLASLYKDVKFGFLIKNALLLLAVFGLAVVATSGKRASMVIVLFIVLCYMVFMTKVSGKVVAALFLPVVVALFAYTGLQEVADEATAFSQQKIEKGLDSSTATSLNARRQINEYIGEIYIDYPLGIGINMGRELIGGGLHNTYYGYLIETGWMGFFCFATLIALAGYKSYFLGNKEGREMLYFLLIPSLLYGFTEYNSAPGQPTFIPIWVAIAYGVSVKKMRRPRFPPSSTFSGAQSNVA